MHAQFQHDSWIHHGCVLSVCIYSNNTSMSRETEFFRNQQLQACKQLATDIIKHVCKGHTMALQDIMKKRACDFIYQNFSNWFSSVVWQAQIGCRIWKCANHKKDYSVHAAALTEGQCHVVMCHCARERAVA